MKLHRVEGVSDWETTAQADMNHWQRLAARTGSVVTPGNILSVIGFSLSLSGLIVLFADRFWLSLALLAVGRLLDLADGWVADKTATKCRLGEKIDATSDKILSLAALIMLPAAGLMSWWLATGLLVVHGAIALIILIVNLKGGVTHSSPVGKVSMAATWLALPIFTVAAAVPSDLSGVASLIAHGFGGLALLLTTVALVGYARMYAKSAFS